MHFKRNSVLFVDKLILDPPAELTCNWSKMGISVDDIFRTLLGFPGDSDGQESACNAGDMDSIPG